jgi:hypothetical protein
MVVEQKSLNNGDGGGRGRKRGGERERETEKWRKGENACS